jgi:cytochrome c biogenesis protein CcmG/thiol:disulfide interchange protein DsbE
VTSETQNALLARSLGALTLIQTPMKPSPACSIVFACLVAFSATAAPADWVGKPFPSLNVTHHGNTPETKGKALLVEFWATWCGPCRESIPHLNELHGKFGNKGLTILGLTDEDQSTVTKFRKKQPMDYAVATDRNGRLNRTFGIKSIPQAFLVGKDGKVLWAGHPLQLEESAIRNALR